jgi:phage recombination protein Bet
MMNEIISGANAAIRPAVTDKELLEYLNTFGGTSALTPTEQIQFLNVAKAYGLNPFKREIYATAYGEGKYRKCSIITGYEVYLKRAERTGLLDGWEANFAGAGESLSCRIIIWRKDWTRSFAHEVYYSEAVQLKDGKPNSVWAKMPRTMLRKVAIGQGFRLCFSDELGGMPYEESEIGTEHDVTEVPPRPAAPDHIADERKMRLDDIKALLEAKSPDDLPYFDEHEIRRWGDRVREIPRGTVSGLTALKEVQESVFARLKQLKAEYKPVEFDDGPGAGETAAKAAALDMYTTPEQEEAEAEEDKVVEEMFEEVRNENLRKNNTSPFTEGDR